MSHVRNTTLVFWVSVCRRPIFYPPPPSSSPLRDVSPTTCDPALFPTPVKERDERRDVSHQRQRPRDISATTSLAASVHISCCHCCSGSVGKHTAAQAAEWKRASAPVDFNRVEITTVQGKILASFISIQATSTWLTKSRDKEWIDGSIDSSNQCLQKHDLWAW